MQDMVQNLLWKPWHGPTINRRGNRGWSVDVEWYEVCSVRPEQVDGLRYTPWVEMMFVSEDDKRGPETESESGPDKFRNGETWFVERIMETWWTVKKKLKSRTPFLTPYRILL